MRRENFSSFTFFIPVENWKNWKQFHTPFFKIHFSFFCKNEIKIFWFLFSNFWKKWKWKFNEFIFQFSKKKNKMEILFLSSLFNFGKKMKIEITQIHFSILPSPSLLEMATTCSAGSRSAKFAAEASITWSTHFDLQVIDPLQWKLNSQWISIFIFFQNYWITNLKTKFPFCFFFEKLENEFVKFSFSFFSKIWKKKLKTLHRFQLKGSVEKGR